MRSNRITCHGAAQPEASGGLAGAKEAVGMRGWSPLPIEANPCLLSAPIGSGRSEQLSDGANELRRSVEKAGFPAMPWIERS